jgi:AraC-like DNA-binding protein
MLNYREYSPGPGLTGIVECLWTSTGGSAVPFAQRILPDGCMDIVFDFSGTPRRTAVIGAMRQAQVFVRGHIVDFLGVRFRPGAFTGLFPIHARELTDGRLDLALVWSEADALWQLLGETPALHRVGQLRSVLAERARSRFRADPCLEHVVRRIEGSGGRIRLGTLGVNARQMERRFAAAVGLSPKMFARVMRFKTVSFAASREEKPDWADLAVRCGYSDQPHLIREFKALSYLTPSEWLASQRR